MDEPVSTRAYDYVPRTPSPRRRSYGYGAPTASPSTLRINNSPSTFSDRHIPNRSHANFTSGFDLWEVSENAKPFNATDEEQPRPPVASPQRWSPSGGAENSQMEFDKLLRSELLGSPPPTNKGDLEACGSPETTNFFQYKATYEEVPLWCGDGDVARSPVPLRVAEQPCQQVKSPPRKIAKTPVKVLDAPDMQDDFYLNLLDWSCQDDLAVALGSNVYLWNAVTCRVKKLCELEDDQRVTSLSWAPQGGRYLAIGSSCSDVTIWDTERCKKLRTMTGHQGHVCSLAWNGFHLSTGGRDGCIFHRDVRVPDQYESQVKAHQSQVCGLKWSFDGQLLASGSDDCKVRIWNLHSKSPLLECRRNQAAVKALAWSPHQSGLLASGGGVADKCIRLWNTTNDTLVKQVDTGSQVCNLAWSRNVNELVSTHGYSLHEIAIWKCPSMTRIAKLTGHSRRVLYLALSADGRKIATGSGDLTIRIWDVFPPELVHSRASSLSMLPHTIR